MEADKTSVLLLDRGGSNYYAQTTSFMARQMHTRFVSSVEKAVMYLATGLYDAILVHERAIKEGLLEFCKKIRDMDPKLLIISSLTMQRDWLEQELFGCGVNDIIFDQSSHASVAVRVAARLADRNKMGFERSGIKLGDMTINIIRREVIRGDSRVLLSQRQAQLLAYFLNNANRIISREELIENVWENMIDPNGRNLDMYIARLRKVLEADPLNPVHLLTVWSAGYRLVFDGLIAEGAPQGACQSTSPDREPPEDAARCRI